MLCSDRDGASTVLDVSEQSRYCGQLPIELATRRRCLAATAPMRKSIQDKPS